MTRVAIVTGASRGIGAATARLLGRKGFAVCVNYRIERDRAERVAADIEATGGRAVAVQADVASEADVRRLFETVDTTLGRLTALVNNAAVLGPRKRVEELTRAELDNILVVNVVGLIRCSQEAIRRMSTHRGGTGGAIVNVSSGIAYLGGAGEAVHYAVSKGAINSFTIGLSQEVAAEGIRVNAVSPGLTRTDMASASALERAPGLIPMGRAGEPEEIAAAIGWLLSDEAAYVAGANLRVAGGRP